MTLPNESSSLTRGEKTKYRLAESMKECMCHTPVDAITVRQITELRSDQTDLLPELHGQI